MPRPATPEPTGLPNPLTLAQAKRAGLTREAVAARLRAGDWVRLRRGAYLRIDDMPEADGQFVAERRDHVHRAIAAARCNPGSVIAVESAALLHGMPLVSAPPTLPQLVLRTGHGSSRARAKFREFAFDDDDVVDLGVPVTTRLRTWSDLARTGRIRDAVAAGDHLTHLGLVDVDDIRLHAATAKGRNCRVMRRAAALIDGRRESPLESWSAVRFAEWGLPAPEWQVDIHDDIGQFVGRVDAWWREQRVIGEADGLAKYTDREVLVAEKHREDRLRALGLQVVRWTWSDLSNEPWRLQVRLERALRPRRPLTLGGFPAA